MGAGAAVSAPTLVLGRPGAYATTLWLRAVGASLGFALVTLAGVAACVVALPAALAGSTPARVVVVAGLVLVAVGSWRSRRAWSRSMRAWVGVRSERRVARRLRRCRPAAVVHGAVLAERGGDADHVVLGPYVAVVETKTGRGRLRVVPDGLEVGGRRMVGDPVSQVRRQARDVSRQLGLQVSSVVCVVDLTGPPQRTGDVVVCSLADLPSVLSQLPRLIDAAGAQRAARALEDASRS